MKAFAVKCLIAYGKIFIDLLVLCWVALSVGYSYEPVGRFVCGTIVRWDYLLPSRIVACELPRVDIPGYIRQGIDYMSAQVRE